MKNVVQRLKSRDAQVAKRAVGEIFSLGTAALPALFELRGDRVAFKGGALGHAMSAQLTFEDAPDVNQERVVSVEVAALYLVEAIYHGRLDFAQSGYLTDVTVPEEQRTARNTRDRVKRAWDAAVKWMRRANLQALDQLRHVGDDPLAGSGVQFW